MSDKENDAADQLPVNMDNAIRIARSTLAAALLSNAPLQDSLFVHEDNEPDFHISPDGGVIAFGFYTEEGWQPEHKLRVEDIPLSQLAELAEREQERQQLIPKLLASAPFTVVAYPQSRGVEISANQDGSATRQYRDGEREDIRIKDLTFLECLAITESLAYLARTKKPKL